MTYKYKEIKHMVYVIVVILMFIVAALKDSGQDSVSSVFIGILILMVVFCAIGAIGSCSSSY